MRNEKIEGIGSVHGGEYDVVAVEGVGKLKGEVTANKIAVEGLLKAKKPLKTGKLNVEGAGRFFGDVKAEEAKIEGLMKLRGASLYAREISCEGLLVCTKEVSADKITVDGICSVKRLFGDVVDIRSEQGAVEQIKGINLIKFCSGMYFGRRVSTRRSICDTLECTALSARRLEAEIVRANSVRLSDECKIGKLYCDGDICYDDTCEIGEIISKNEKIKNNKDKEGLLMADATLVKILEMYKAGKIGADEAEKMLSSAGFAGAGAAPKREAITGKTGDIDWEDDGKLRIVAFIGRKLLKKGAEESKKLEVSYDGPALDVVSHLSLTCGDIRGNATAGSHIKCANISGNVTAGSSVECGDVGASITAGSSIRAKCVKGNIRAGSSVTIEK